MARPYVFAVLIAPALAFAGCFPDYQVGEGANGDGGATNDGGGDDGATGDGGAGDGHTGDGGGDGGNAFHAAASKLVPQGSFVFTTPGGSMTTANVTHHFSST